MKHLFDLMDDETRFWVAKEAAETKHTHDASDLSERKPKSPARDL